MRDKLAARSDDGTPLYLQLARNLRDHIDSGGITPGNALPSERDLSEMAGISRVTVRKAIEQLIEEGVLVRKQGSGTFVARRIASPGEVYCTVLGNGVDVHVLAFNASNEGVVPQKGPPLRGGGLAHEGRQGLPSLVRFFLRKRVDHHAPVSVMARDPARGVPPARCNEYR